MHFYMGFDFSRVDAAQLNSEDVVKRFIQPHARIARYGKRGFV